jgi:hypothetical protein
MARQLLAVITEPVELMALRSPVTVALRASVGLVTHGPYRGLSISVRLRRADRACDTPNDTTRVHACAWTPEMDAAPIPPPRPRRPHHTT